MSDQDIPTSGSRWEPADAASDGTQPQPVGTPVEPATVSAEHAAGEPTVSPADAPAEPAAAADGTELSPRRLRNRSAVAAAGVGLVLAGAFGGFAIGHAIAGSDGSGNGVSTDADQNAVPGGPRDGAGHGGPPGSDRDGDGQNGHGTAPGQSTPGGSGSSPGDGEGGTA